MPMVSTFSGGGGGGSGPRLDKAYYNFPLSIGPDFPVPVVDGHIYVQLPEEQAAQITKVYIDSAVRVSHEDNSLILVGQNRDTYLSIQEVRKADGREIIVSDLINADAQANGWQAGYNADTNSIRKTMPMVYAKLGGVVEMQTAWVCHGDKWVQLSVKGQYFMLSDCLASSATEKISVYNWNGDQTFTKNDAFPAPAFPVVSAQISPDGRFVFYLSTQSPYLFGYRRTGETWEQLPTINYDARAPHTLISQLGLRGIAFSPSGHHMAVSVSGGVDLYRRTADGGTYEYIAKITDIVTATALQYTPDGSALYAGANDRAVYCYEIVGDTYTRAAGSFLSTEIATSYCNASAIAFSSDGTHIAISYYSTSVTTTQAGSYYYSGGVVWAHLRNGRIPVQEAILSFYPTQSNASYNPVSATDVAIVPDGKYVIWCANNTIDKAGNRVGFGLWAARVEDDNLVSSKRLEGVVPSGSSTHVLRLSLSQDGSRAFLVNQGAGTRWLMAIDYETMTATPVSTDTLPELSQKYQPQFVPYNTIML